MADSLSSTVRALICTLQSKSAQRVIQAEQLASDLYTLCIESVSDTELAYCSSILFNRENGIIHFLKESATLKEFAKSQEHILNLLESYIKAHSKNVLQYAIEIKEVCNTLFSRNESSKVKNAIFPPLIAILELCCAQSSFVEQLNLPKLAEKFYRACHETTKNVSTVRGGIFQLLGRLCELYPEVMTCHSEGLIKIMAGTLKLENGKKKPDMPVIGGCLKGLCSYLINFTQSVSEGSAYAETIYKCTRVAINTDIAHTRYEVPRAGLSIIATHAAQFKEYLAKDYKYMYDSITIWSSHNNRENRKIAVSALDSFLQQVSIYIGESASENRANMVIFKYLVQKFRKSIESQTSSNHELALAVKGYGYFAAPCKIFMKPEDVKFMFNEMVNRTEQLFFSPAESQDNRFINLPSFLTALASIVKEVQEISQSFILSLEKLLVLFFECYPILPPVNLWHAHVAVLNIIIGMYHFSRATLKTFLSHIIFQGVAISCSHPPVVNVGDESSGVYVAEEDQTDVLGRKNASFQDYVELWVHLLDPTKLKGMTLRSMDPTSRKILHRIIYDEFVSTIFKVIHHLNLSSQESSLESSTGTEDQKEPSPPTAVTSELSTRLREPIVPKDFHVFINLVDLAKAVLLKVQASMFEEWVYFFGHEAITLSSRHPLISGFHKLLALCFKICKIINYFKDIDDTPTLDCSQDAMETSAMETTMDRNVCFILFKKYVKEVLVRMRQYKDDLLVSCLHLLLSLPRELVQLELASLIPALQTTFKLGLSYLPLAHAGLDALEAWRRELPSQVLQPHFKHILPHLDDYLRTLGTQDPTASETRGTVVMTTRPSSRSRGNARLVTQWKEGVEGAESPLDQLRQRIVFFLGSLGGQINSSLVETESAASYASKMVAWDSKNRLEFALPFQDMKPSIYLDSFLPRVCELSISSSDRQTKIVACELLHALVLFVIGKSAQPAHHNKSPMTHLYKHLFPVVLQLGCDVEQVTEKLFRPLVFQMIHWFTRNTQYESPDTIALLDAILEGVVHPTDSSLREFSAICIKEFLIWSIKQTSKKQQEKSPINTKSLLKRIYSLALHPSAAKRLGAALAINSIYTVFREEESLVDTFVMELLIHMFTSLKLAHKDNKAQGTQHQTCQAIDHISRIIRVKALLFSKPSKSRRVPKGMKGALLTDLVLWLLFQCGSPETACRNKSRELFCELAGHLPKITSDRVWIRKSFESEGGSYFIDRFEGGGKNRGGIQKQPILSGQVFSLSETISWFERVMAALDCYNWVLKEDMLKFDEIFLVTKKPESCLLQSLCFFLTKLALTGVEEASRCYASSLESVYTPHELEEYNRIKSSLIMDLLKFAAILVDHRYDNSPLLSSFWCEDMFRLVSLSCLSPSAVGFDVSDIEVIDKLSQLVLDTLKNMSKSLSLEIKSSLLEALSQEMIQSSCDLIGQLPLFLHGDSTEVLKDRVLLNSIIQGHLMLHRADLLVPLLKKKMVDPLAAEGVVSKLLASVTGTMAPLVSADSSPKAKGESLLNPDNEKTLGLLLQLTLEMGIKPEVLLNCLLDLSSNEEAQELGLLTYHSFSNLFNNHFVSDYELYLSHLLQYSRQKPDYVSTILSSFLEHVSREKKLRQKYGSKISSYLISHWSSLASWWGKEVFIPDRRLAAINILKCMVSIDKKILLTECSGDPEGAIEPIFSMYLFLLEEKESSLAFKSQILEVLHHFASLPDHYVQRLKASILKMISQQFPLKSTELQTRSPQYNEYIACLDKFLRGMVLSRSLALMEILIRIMCCETRHAHEDKIQSSLEEFMTTSSGAKSAIDVAYHVFRDEEKYLPELRKAAGERVCLPLLMSCDLVPLREFFLDHICEIMGTLEASLSKNKVESQLVSKLCCFHMMGVLYARLSDKALTKPESSIIRAYCKGGEPKTGKELTQAITKASHGAKSEDLHGNKDCYELRRQYHCAAYNTLMAVIVCTQSKMQFYHGFLFKEDTVKGQMLWDNLVDLDKTYNFKIELEKPLHRKKEMSAIRDEMRTTRDSLSPVDSSPSYSPHYMSSQYLVDSSLSTMVSQFDFSGGTKAFPSLHLSSPSEVSSLSYIITEEDIEQDELNLHECMLPLMKLLDHMTHNKINPEVPSGTVPTEMPAWMTALHKKFNSSHTHRNIRILLGRLICNRSKVFQPYARYWLTPLVQLIVSGDNGGAGLHYFVVDLVVTILSWSSTAVMEDTYLANRLLTYLMEHCSHDNKSVLRNNLEIVKTLVECWKDKLQPSSKIIFDHFGKMSSEGTDSRTGIQLLGIVVANGMPPYDPDTAGAVDEKKFLETFVSLMSYKYKEVYAAAGEVTGMILEYMDKHQHSNLENLRTSVIQRLKELATSRNEDKFLTCLNKIQLHYNKITECFVEKLLFLLPNFHGLFRSMCLEILLPQADIRPQFYIELKDKGLHDMLTHRDEPTQTAALHLVQRMVQHHSLDNKQQCKLFPLVINFGSHSSEICREIMYDILIAAYRNILEIEGDSPDTKELMNSMRDQLLQGLSDDTEGIRLKMYGFWNEESHLPSSTLPRLTQLLPVLYSNKVEKQFLYHATNLLLELTSRSPDFTRSIFDSPLSECKFEEYSSINLSWKQRHLQMTPLFAATQASQSGSPQNDQTVGGSVAEGGALRATQQGLAFTPTQDGGGGGGGYTWMTPSFQSMDSSSSSSLFTIGSHDLVNQDKDSSALLFRRPQGRPRNRPVGSNFGKAMLHPDDLNSPQDAKEERRNEIMKLKRRFMKDRKIANDAFAKSGARKKIMRKEHHRQERASRDSKIVMYRKYRHGELPDIQIKYSELIRPFQALAQRDSTLARTLFTLLYESIFKQVDSMLTEDEADATKKAIKDGFNQVMETTIQFHPPFIGSLQEICYREKQLELNPEAVSRVSIRSMQEPIGIMLLEKQLLTNDDQVLQPRPAKKARGVFKPTPECTDAWVQLSRLYKSLGNFDAVRGIFSSRIGTKSETKDALEAEERVDYPQALQIYKEALRCESWPDLDGSPTEIEKDLWEDSLLSCCHELTKWEDLEKAAMLNVDDSSSPNFDGLWEDDYSKDHYLPHVIRSKVKLACSEKDDHYFSEFLDRALDDPAHKQLLESKHSAELALYSIVKDNIDRARYYSNLSLQAFLRDWSDMDKLLISSRANRLQSLQTLTEIHEYIDFVSNSANLKSVEAVRVFLGAWQSRYPHEKKDSLSVWNDVVTGRCMMMRKIMEKFTDHGSGGDLSSLKDLFSLEYTKLYLKMADSARIQSNYAVATTYLELTEQAITQYFPSDIGLQLEWVHTVAEMRVQQAEWDPSPPQITQLIALVERFDGYGSQDILKTNHNLARCHHLLKGKSFGILARAFSEQGELLMEVLSDDRRKQLHSVIQVPPSDDLSLEQISKKLLLRGMAALKSGVKSGTAKHKDSGCPEGMLQALVAMANFCDQELRMKEDEEKDSLLDDSQFPSVVVTYSLKAMRHNSKAAVQKVPRLLQIIDLYPDTLAIFKKKSDDVPSWMFISWISQLVAVLDKPEGPAIHNILFSIARDYPQALYYPLKISSHDYTFDSSTSSGRENSEAVAKLKAMVTNKELDRFVSALELLCSPELVVKDFFENDLRQVMEASVERRDNNKVAKVWSQIYNQLQEWEAGSSSSLYGEDTPSMEIGNLQKRFAKEYNKFIIDKFGRDGSKLKKMNPRQFRSITDDFSTRARPSLNKTQGHMLLKDYSPFLASFQGNQCPESIEIPGQYEGKSKPLPEYHVKISGFDEKVLVMTSIRKPKRITIRGDDEKDYMFLVKGGEDLRLDQRIEQLYASMNEILDQDPASSQRGLRLRTYQVIPMTTRIGLIEWMKKTKPLKDFLRDALEENEMKSYDKAGVWHADWIKTKFQDSYKVMYRKASRSDVESQYKRKVLCVPPDLLRRAFLHLASSPEAFLILRTHFLRTLATLSMCQYVLGIGDRHLSNFMVDLESGGIIGIDFGHNFGTATQFLPFPELMPFRLTPQFTNLLLPHVESSQGRTSGQLRSCMVHSLRALRNSQQLLLNTMDVFVKEPALDWKSFARKQAKALRKPLETDQEEGTWYPREKIRSARKKLQGYNSAHVMLVDLENGHGKSQEFPFLKRMLVGDKKLNTRAKIGERCNTVEEQVACLWDHATDQNILGMTWRGWEPWV